jgi:phenylpropionate dioxygenase-like ring-hydroxylating dioxygenase large terminal subunit
VKSKAALPMPQGWFCAIPSHRLPLRGVQPLRLFGHELVVCRTEDGRAHVYDATCPHMGAHLGYGGRVAGNSLICPFHEWKYACDDGRCLEIPYARKVPQVALGSWPTDEKNGVVLVYYDAEKRPPPYTFPSFEECSGTGGWQPISFLDKAYRVPVPCQDVAENAIDYPHVRAVHHMFKLPEPDAVEIEERDWQLQVNIRLPADVPLGKVSPPGSVTVYGPGILGVRFDPPIPGVSGFELFCFSPIDEEMVELNVGYALRRAGAGEIDLPLREAVKGYLVRATEEDVRIWEHKRYLDRPVLCEGDAPIHRWRSWYRRFYP